MDCSQRLQKAAAFGIGALFGIGSMIALRPASLSGGSAEDPKAESGSHSPAFTRSTSVSAEGNARRIGNRKSLLSSDKNESEKETIGSDPQLADLQEKFRKLRLRHKTLLGIFEGVRPYLDEKLPPLDKAGIDAITTEVLDDLRAGKVIFNPGAIPENGTPVSSVTQLKPNQIMSIRWHDTWWAGRVEKVNPDGTVDIGYYGWSQKETVTLDRLRIDPTSEIVAYELASEHPQFTDRIAAEFQHRAGQRRLQAAIAK